MEVIVHSKLAIVAALATLAAWSGTTAAEQPGDHSRFEAPLDLAYRPVDNLSVDFKSANIAGLEQRQLTSSVQVRGWQVAQNIYFGRARVGDRSGVGLVFDQGDTVIGINHRGIQFTRDF